MDELRTYINDRIAELTVERQEFVTNERDFIAGQEVHATHLREALREAEALVADRKVAMQQRDAAYGAAIGELQRALDTVNGDIDF